MSQPAGSEGYCPICYHPLDRCSHCDAASPVREDRPVRDLIADLVDVAYVEGTATNWRLCLGCEMEHHVEAHANDEAHAKPDCVVKRAERWLRDWRVGEGAGRASFRGQEPQAVEKEKREVWRCHCGGAVSLISNPPGDVIVGICLANGHIVKGQKGEGAGLVSPEGRQETKP